MLSPLLSSPPKDVYLSKAFLPYMGSEERREGMNDEKKGKGDYRGGEVLLKVPGGGKHCASGLLRLLLRVQELS